jgi:hypothetical protein
MGTTRDSGVIDLFAMHKEEEARLSAVPSAPPPAVALDIGGSGITDDDVEGFAAAQNKARARTKLIGGIVGGLAVIGIVIAAAVVGGKDAPKPTAAAEPPPPAAVPPPVVEPAPPAPAPTPSTKASTEKPEYTPASAAAAYAASQGKKKPMSATRAPRSAPIGGGVKLQKVQSSGVGP